MRAFQWVGLMFLELGPIWSTLHTRQTILGKIMCGDRRHYRINQPFRLPTL